MLHYMIMIDVLHYMIFFWEGGGESGPMAAGSFCRRPNPDLALFDSTPETSLAALGHDSGFRVWGLPRWKSRWRTQVKDNFPLTPNSYYQTVHSIYNIRCPQMRRHTREAERRQAARKTRRQEGRGMPKYRPSGLQPFAQLRAAAGLVLLPFRSLVTSADPFRGFPPVACGSLPKP